MLLLLFSSAAFAKEYRVDHGNSEIRFSGEHAGMGFSGRFEKWQASIIFAPSDLTSSQFTARFDTGSARTGDRTYDETLLEADWFDVENHPFAAFETTGFKQNPDGSFIARGTLTIRAITHPIEFTFRFADGNNQTSSLDGEFVLDRLAYGIGEESDPVAEWVSREIGVAFSLRLSAP